MFTHLRESAKGFFAKLILFFLVGMFVLWGIGDVFRNMAGGPVNVATVGKTPITAQEFKTAMKKGNGPAADVLGGLVNDMIIDKEAAAEGIVVTDDEVADFISNLSEFKGKGGQFDKEVYQSMLMNAGLSEHRFVEEIRREIAAKLLLGAFTSEAQVPEILVESRYRSQEEQRIANLILLSASAVSGRIPALTEKEIKTYYDANPKPFMAPEYRTLTYVIVSQGDIQAKVDVPEAEIKQMYDERGQDFRQPERREIEEMQFDNEQDAKDAEQKLSKGEAFAKLATSAAVTNKDKMSLGVKTKQEIPAQAAGPVFGIKEGENTAPIMVDFSWRVYHVSKILPDQADTFEQAHKQIAGEIAAREAQATATTLVDGLQDAMASGQSLEGAAEKAGGKAQIIGPITRDGMLQNGQKAKLPAYDNFLNVAFTTPEKDHSQAVQAQDGSYFLIRVDSVTPEHVKPLADVKDQVMKAALAEKTETQLQATAQAMFDALHAGKTFEAAETAANISTKTYSSGAMKRAMQAVPGGSLKGQALPRAMVSELFGLHPHEATHAYPTGDGHYVIGILDQVISAPENPDPKALADIRAALKDTVTNEALHDYLTYLRGKFPVTVNSAVLNAMDTPSPDAKGQHGKDEDGSE